MTCSFLRQLLVVIAIATGFLQPLEAQVIQSIRRASLAPNDNAQGKSYSYDPSMDGTGRYVAFTSTADNFTAPGATLGQKHEHVYIRDTQTGVTTQLDVTSDGQTGSPGLSFNPDLRVFRSSFHPHVSRDGKFIIFSSSASNISPDGQGEQYGNWAYIKNIETGIIQRIPYATAGDDSKSEYPTYLALNGDASKVVVISIISDSSDTTCATCVWEMTLYDRNSNTATLINTGVTGNKFNPALSDDGRFLVFENQVGDFSAPTYSYLYDLELNQLTALNDGNQALSPAIGGDGTYIAYSDSSTVPTRIKLRERESGNEIPVSYGTNGEEPNGISEFAALSQDGRYIAFLSTASNLVEGDYNKSDDIFVYDRISGKTVLVSVQGTCKGISSTEDFNTGPPSISSDGKIITFAVLERLIAADKRASDGTLERADTNSFDDVYYVTLDYDAQPVLFRKQLTPLAPRASVNCSGSEARLQLEDIVAAQGTSAAQGKNKGIKSISQTVIISKLSSSTKASSTSRGQVRQKIVTKRNIVTTRGLPPGVYSAQVQARATYRDGSTLTTKPGRATKFIITR